MQCNRQEEFILNISLLEYADLVKQYILNVEIKEIWHLMNFMYEMSSDCSTYMDEKFNEEILELENKINYKQTKTQMFNKKVANNFYGWTWNENVLLSWFPVIIVFSSHVYQSGPFKYGASSMGI